MFSTIRTIAVKAVVGGSELSLSVECDAFKSPSRMARLERRIGLLADHPTIRVERSANTATLVARLDGFDRTSEASWDKAVPWTLAYLTTLVEVFSREGESKARRRASRCRH